MLLIKVHSLIKSLAMLRRNTKLYQNKNDKPSLKLVLRYVNRFSFTFLSLLLFGTLL